jgi:SAM-dependent methyltransferase
MRLAVRSCRLVGSAESAGTRRASILITLSDRRWVRGQCASIRHALGREHGRLAWAATGRSRRRSSGMAVYAADHGPARTPREAIRLGRAGRRVGREVQRARRREVERTPERAAGRRGPSLPPGRALDVGCGEGADAIWLARNGWTVTAIDISYVAVIRARETAERAGAAVEWVCGDALHKPLPAGSFDLVSMQYPALPTAAGEAAVRALLGTVRPSGLLLAGCHDLSDEHREHMKSQGAGPGGLCRCGRPCPAAGRRIHDRAARGPAAHRPAARYPAHRRRRPARPGAAEAQPGLVFAHAGVRLNGSLHYGLCASAGRRAPQAGGLRGPHGGPRPAL